MDTRVCKGIWILEHSKLSGYLSILGNMDTRVYFGNMDTRVYFGNMDTRVYFGNMDTRVYFGNMDTRVYFGNIDTTERNDLTLLNLKLSGKFY